MRASGIWIRCCTHICPPLRHVPAFGSKDTSVNCVWKSVHKNIKVRTILASTHSKWGQMCIASTCKTKQGYGLYSLYPLYPYRQSTYHCKYATKRGHKFCPRFVKMSSLWQYQTHSHPRFKCHGERANTSLTLLMPLSWGRKMAFWKQGIFVTQIINPKPIIPPW